MRNSIPGKDSVKDMIWDLFKDEPDHVLVMIEGFDQFKNTYVIKEIRQMLTDKATNVLLTIRKGHPTVTTSFRRLFNHQIEVKGFTKKGGAQFAQKYMKEINHPDGHTKLFVDAIHERPQIETNPLNLTLACQLYHNGQLSISNLETLTEYQLYKMREERMLDLEIMKQDEEIDPDVLSSKREEELGKIHTLAVYMILGNKTVCKKADLEILNIDPGSSAMVLLERIRKTSVKDGHQQHWAWPHPRLQEFAAAMALADIDCFSESQWLYWVSSRSDLNPVAKLAVAKFKEEEMFDEVVALTRASVILQGNVTCKKHEEGHVDSCDPFQPITKIHEMLVKTMDVQKVFEGGKCKVLTTVNELDLEAIAECNSHSFFTDNIKLFLHIQNCWKLGLDEENDCVLELESLLLPAVDGSEAGVMHLMLRDPSGWKENWNSSESISTTLLEVHTGVSTVHTDSQTDEWLKSLLDILDHCKPQVLHFHHKWDKCRIPHEFISAVNERSYLIGSRNNTWTLWFDADDEMTKQQYIRGRSTFAYITRNKYDEITINVKNIKDVLDIDAYPSLRTLSINVGFPTFSSDDDTSDKETPSTFRETVDYILKTWHLEHGLILRSFTPDIQVVTLAFTNQLQKARGFDAMVENEAEIRFTKMQHVIEKGADCPNIAYRSYGGITNIRVQRFRNESDITFTGLCLNDKDKLVVVLPASECTLQTRKAAEELDRMVQCVLSVYKVKHLTIKFDCDPKGLTDKLNECGTFFTDDGVVRFKRHNNALKISRVSGTMEEVWNPNETEVIGVAAENESEGCTVVLCKPIVEAVEDIQRSLWQDDLSLEISRPWCTMLENNAGHDQYKMWERTIHYLLKMAQPLKFSPPDFGPNLPPAIHIDDTTCYVVGDGKRRRPIYTMYNDVRNVKITGTERTIVIKEYKSTRVEMFVHQPSDCMQLERFHVNSKTVKYLSVRLKSPNIQCSNVVWKKAVDHILETYSPLQCVVHATFTKTEMEAGPTNVGSASGTSYVGLWNKKGGCLTFNRWDDVQFVDVSKSARSFPICEDDTGNVRVAVYEPSDCMELQKHHVKNSEVHSMSVTFCNMVPDDTANGGDPAERYCHLVRHLLQTYKPSELTIVVGIHNAELLLCTNMELDGKLFYLSTWSKGKECLTFRKWNGIQKTLHNSAGNVVVCEDGANGVRIMTCNPMDCLQLERHHIEADVIDNMSVFFCKALHKRTTDDSPNELLDDFRNVVQHLLRVFRPSVCCMRNSDVKVVSKDHEKTTKLKSCLTLHLDDVAYIPFQCEEDASCLCFKRFIDIPVPSSARTLSLREDGVGCVQIVADQAVDCMRLQSKDVENRVLHLAVILHNVLDTAGSVSGGWLKAIEHLRFLYNPVVLELQVPMSQKETVDKYLDDHELFSDNTLELYFLHANNRNKYFITSPRVCETRSVKVPGTSRYVEASVLLDTGECWFIVNRAMDCLTPHCLGMFICHNLWDLEVILKPILHTEFDTHQKNRECEEWQQAVSTLFKLYERGRCSIHIPNSQANLSKGLRIPLNEDDGSRSVCFLGKNKSILTRLCSFDDIQFVKLPNGTRSVPIFTNAFGEVMVVAYEMNDCLELQECHIERLSNDGTLHLPRYQVEAVAALAEACDNCDNCCNLICCPRQSRSRGLMDRNERHVDDDDIVDEAQNQEISRDAEVSSGSGDGGASHRHINKGKETDLGKSAENIRMNSPATRHGQDDDDIVDEVQNQEISRDAEVPSGSGDGGASHRHIKIRKIHYLGKSPDDYLLKENWSFRKLELTEGWQQVVRHLLQLFQPSVCSLDVEYVPSDMPCHITLDDGTMYTGSWESLDYENLLIFNRVGSLSMSDGLADIESTSTARYINEEFKPLLSEIA